MSPLAGDLARGWRWPWRRAGDPAPRLLDRLANPTDDLLALFVQGAAVGIAILDHRGCNVRSNDALRRMAEGDRVSPGRPVRGLFAADREREFCDRLTAALCGRRSDRGFVSLLRSHGGRPERTVEVSIMPVREGDGTISGAIMQLNDITAQRRLEAQLAQSQKLQAVGQLAGGIAHDFNNLLTAVMGAADDALARVQPDDEILEDLEQIRGSAERGAGLVRQLLAFGRQQTLQPRPVAINEAIEALSGLLRRLLGSHIQLELNLQQPGPLVRVDPTQLDQVVINLAVNARDAMETGGQLTLHTGQIALYRPLVRGSETIPPGRYVMLEVEDSGGGINADVLPFIFDPFFTTRRDRGGTGLGLSTVHGIVRQSDGFLAVDSVAGKGTRFRIYLPRYDGESVTIPPVPEHERQTACVASPGHLRTVLLVDDDDAIRRLAERALIRAGWRVISAGSGDAALLLLAELRGGALDAVISDVVMPGIDGPRLLRAVRAVYPNVPAILASGYAEGTRFAELPPEGVRFIEKPFSMKDLVQAAAELRPT